jgi:hypothetical protein
VQGARIEAIMNRTAKDVSVDFLSRVLVDVQLDSSKVLACFAGCWHKSWIMNACLWASGLCKDEGEESRR